MAAVDWIRFQRAFGFGTVRAARALERWHSPEAIFSSQSDTIPTASFSHDELEGIREAKGFDPTPIFEYCDKNRVRILTPDDGEYPESLRNIYSPPAVLYIAGHWEDIDRSLRIAVVGSRDCTSYGGDAARKISRGLAEKGVITVSGLAAGIDSNCHIATLEAGGRTLAVQGCGIDVTYPAANVGLKESILKNGGAVLTEFPPGEEPLAFHFPIRNRIIAGLCQGVVVVEGKRKSGSLITAGCALTEGRDVFAVPGNVDQPLSQAPNWLIREGATMVRGAEDILEEYDNLEYCAYYALPGHPVSVTVRYGDRTQEKKREKTPLLPSETDNLNEKQRTVLNAIGKEPKSADEITRETGLPISAVLSVLTQLEIFGIIKAHAGHRFSR